MPDELLDRNGRPVVVKRIPMSTGRGKFKSSKKKFTSADSPFEKFSDSNGGRSKCKSF